MTHGDSWGRRWRWRDALKWAWQHLLPLAAVVLAYIAVQGTGETAEDARELAVDNRATLVKLERVQRQANREGRQRRDQTCTVFERQHRSDVRQLRGTYRYLRTLPPQERETNLTRTIIAGLPKQEREAKRDSAPIYCDEPGVKAERLWRADKRNGVPPSKRRGAPPIGLKEPDPVIPARPKALRPRR